MMKKALLLALTGVLALSMVGCSSKKKETEAKVEAEEAEKTTAGDVYNVMYLVNGNLGDKSFFDSAKSGLDTLAADGRINLSYVEMGGTDADQPKWLSNLYDAADSEEYDLIICGTYQMPDYLKEVAEAYPDQKFLIFDDDTYAGEDSNVVNIVFKQNDLGYIVGTFAAKMTQDTNVERINADKVLGFVGGFDSPVINDFMVGFIRSAISSGVLPVMQVTARQKLSLRQTAAGSSALTPTRS